jgi:SAM-dependent methyltransferase
MDDWDAFDADPAVAANTPTWRRYSDRVNARLVARRLPGRYGRVLKTDLFDESLTDGLLPVLRARAERVTGVDVSPAIVAAARARHPGLDAAQADVRALPFEEGAFDAIVSNSTLDHLPGWAAVGEGIAELRRVLKPGAPLLITLDNALNPAVAARGPLRPLLPAQLAPYPQGPACGPGRLRRLLEAGGFAVEATECVLHCPRVVAIPLAARRDRLDPAGAERRAAGLMRFEALGRLPVSRAFTGHFAAALARRQ